MELFEDFLVGDFEVLEVADCEKVHADMDVRDRGSYDKGENN